MENTMSEFNPTQTFTEEDMSKIRGLFAHAADSIVNASHLSAEVQGLKNTMNELKQSYEEIAANNKFLIRQIGTLEVEVSEVKRERDEARTELSTFNQRIAQRDDEIKELQTSHNEQAETIARLRRESDEHMMRALKAEETVDKIKERFMAVKSSLKDLDADLSEVDALLYPPADFLQPTPQVATPDYEPVPEGVTVVPLDEPREVHNAIAEAVGEPKIEEEKKEETFTDMPWRHGFASSAS
jgi:chromosome segregation ATPase